jgi:large subunit ribosomal protein L6
MSKLTRKPLVLDPKLKASFADGVFVMSNGKASLSLAIKDSVKVEINGTSVSVSPSDETKFAKSYSGTIYRTLMSYSAGLSNPKGHSVFLTMQGVGYKAVLSSDAKTLTLTLGYSHNIAVEIPAGIEVSVEKNTQITFSGFDKVVLMDFARFVRKLRRPNVYNGSGVYVKDAPIRRKEGKKAKK